MPAPGSTDRVVGNPFQEPAQRIAQYTAEEIATLQSRLEKRLGPEYLSARSGPSGQKVHYIAADKVIQLANEVFGFNGWSSSIQTVQIDFVDEHPQTLRISIGLSVIVRVTLRDGTYHEDIGYGHIENCKGKAAAFEKAKKEARTDAVKRALRNFGNVLGNCLYDKEYVNKVSRMKVAPVRKFEEHSLHRHADFKTVVVPAAPALKSEPSSTVDSSTFSMDGFDEDLLGDFDEADFCVAEEGHPDEIIVPDPSVPALPPPARLNQSRSVSPVRQPPPPQQNYGKNMPPRPQGNGGSFAQRAPQTPTPANNRANGPVGARPYQPGNNQAGRPPQPAAAAGNGAQKPGGGGIKEEEGTPWLSARAIAKAGDGDALAAVAPSIQAGHLFNPKTESPSIRKTPGVDHSSSKPVPRMGNRVGGGPPGTPSGGPAVGAPVVGAAAAAGTPGLGRGIQEPAGRRIGAPPSTASPLANRGQFRPPPMKRGPPTDAAGGRPPLADVPHNVPVNGAAGVDAKRQKMA